MTYSPEQLEAWEKVRAAGRRYLAVGKYYELISADIIAELTKDDTDKEVGQVLGECLDAISALLHREMHANTDARLTFDAIPGPASDTPESDPK